MARHAFTKGYAHSTQICLRSRKKISSLLTPAFKHPEQLYVEDTFKWQAVSVKQNDMM